MTVEIRAARPDEMEEIRRVGGYAFANTEDDPADASNDTLQPEWTTCAFVNGRMAVTSAAYPFLARLNGAPVPMAGVTAVSAYPEFRRQGLLRKIMEESFREQRERGQNIAILWASMGAIYQRFGYGLASTQVQYEFDPRYAGFESPVVPSGSAGLMAKDEALPILKRLYIQYSAPRNLMLHRAPPVWTARLRERDKQRVYVAVYRNAEGEPTGYMQYETKWRPDSGEPGPNQVMTVQDFIAVDMDAYRGMWEYIRTHDLVAAVRMFPSEEDPAPSLLLEPRELKRRTNDGVWLRVVDVERALPQRPYGDRGELTIAIEGDTICDWNNGTYLLETDGQQSEVTQVDRDADLTMPVRTLAQLISGYRSASQLARAELLEARDERALQTADRLFATVYRPYCPDGF